MATKYDVVVKNLRAALAACGNETKIQEAKSLIGRAINSVISSSEKKSAKANAMQKMFDDSQQNAKNWWDDIKKGLEKTNEKNSEESQGGE